MSISIKVEVLAGTDIPKDAIPGMIKLADKLGCSIEARLNGVLVVACPGDSVFDLAYAFDDELRSKKPVKIAFASNGRTLWQKLKDKS